MNLVSIIIPSYNEEANIQLFCEAVINQFNTALSGYDYEIIIIDNDSQDGTREIIRSLCRQNPKIKAIFNTRNFGSLNSVVHALYQAKGDCAIMICADFQEPVEMIPEFVAEWENGHKMVCGIKTNSEENKIVYLLRTLYYKSIRKMSDVQLIDHFNGFGLYDRSVLEVMKKVQDPTPSIRGLVAELGFKHKDIPFTQQRRRAGKSSFNFYKLYDTAMLNITSYTKVGLRLATFLGVIFSIICLLVALVYLILKLIFWNQFMAGTAPMIIGVFLLGSIQLFFIGVLGEYLLNVNTRVLNRPIVVEEERLNFDDEACPPNSNAAHTTPESRKNPNVEKM